MWAFKYKSQLREAPAHDQKYALEAIQMAKVTERLKSHKIFIQTNASPHWCEELEGFQDVYSSAENRFHSSQWENLDTNNEKMAQEDSHVRDGRKGNNLKSP